MRKDFTEVELKEIAAAVASKLSVPVTDISVEQNEDGSLTVCNGERCIRCSHIDEIWERIAELAPDDNTPTPF